MKRMILLFLVLLLLTGCGVAETFETVTDEPVCEVLAQPREMHFFLAEESVLPVMETEGRKLYLCGEYDVMSQILEGGDLDRTIRQVSGFSPEDLTVIQTGSGDVEKTEFVWTNSTEEGQKICRATILDDGNYHYVLSATVFADKIEEYQEILNGIFETFELV